MPHEGEALSTKIDVNESKKKELKDEIVCYYVYLYLLGKRKEKPRQGNGNRWSRKSI